MGERPLAAPFCPTRRRRPALAVLGILTAAALPPSTHAGDSLPYRLAVEVGYAADTGSQRLAGDIRDRLLEEIEARGVVDRVVGTARDEAVEADLVLTVELFDVLQETRYGASIGDRSRNPDPHVQRNYVAVFQVDVRVELVAHPEGVVVRSARFREFVSRAPRTLDEDAEWAAREEAVQGLVRSVRKAAFKGSPNKLRAKIEHARARASEPPSRR